VIVDAEYLLPLRWTDDTHLDELADYLSRLVRWLPVTVVDGSPAAGFARHRAAFPDAVRHLRPDPSTALNGKVAGVLTGLRHRRAEQIVIADDDVRYDRAGLLAALDRLRDADLVRPQNVFHPQPWHARWDTARSLLNRSLGGDYPGTLVLRADALGTSGYDGDVLFENLELIRTVLARGGRMCRADDLYVLRRPPSTGHFWRQRVRQAYDSLAQPPRFLAELALLPIAVATRRRGGPALIALAAVAVAEAGRRRQGGRSVYPRSAALWAPVWLAERALLAWLVLPLCAVGGVRYAGHRVAHAATPLRVLRHDQDQDQESR